MNCLFYGMQWILMFYMECMGAYGLCKKRWLYGCIRLFLPCYLYSMYMASLYPHKIGSSSISVFVETLRQGRASSLYVLGIWLVFLLICLYDGYSLYQQVGKQMQ